jgi:hypothetical protein
MQANSDGCHRLRGLAGRTLPARPASLPDRPRPDRLVLYRGEPAPFNGPGGSKTIQTGTIRSSPTRRPPQQPPEAVPARQAAQPDVQGVVHPGLGLAAGARDLAGPDGGPAPVRRRHASAQVRTPSSVSRGCRCFWGRPRRSWSSRARVIPPGRPWRPARRASWTVPHLTPGHSGIRPSLRPGQRPVRACQASAQPRMCSTVSSGVGGLGSRAGGRSAALRGASSRDNDDPPGRPRQPSHRH